jgi:hypothetical protein
MACSADTNGEQFASAVKILYNDITVLRVQIKDGRVNTYMDLAASLKPALTAMGGCLFIDRFKSLTRENLLLS